MRYILLIKQLLIIYSKNIINKALYRYIYIIILTSIKNIKYYGK